MPTTTLTTADDLWRAGLIAAADRPAYAELLQRYRLAIPAYYANLIDRDDPVEAAGVRVGVELDEDLLHKVLSAVSHQPAGEPGRSRPADS